MKTIDKQAILNVLNGLEVIEQNGGEDAYILVENNAANHEKLNAVGVPSETINKYGDDETFCILALAFNEGYANELEYSKLVLRPDKFTVYDSTYNEFSLHDTYKSALAEYEATKESIVEESLSGDEQVYILEVKKVACIVDDKDRKMIQQKKVLMDGASGKKQILINSNYCTI